MQIGDKIYHLDYEESKCSYTIRGFDKMIINEFTDAEETIDVVIVSSDNVSIPYPLCKTYPISICDLDRFDGYGRFFTSTEKANEGLRLWEERISKL